MRANLQCFTLAAAATFLCISVQPALADFGEYDKGSYPKAISKRPLVLAKSMLEVSLGAASDTVGATEADRVGLRADVAYGLASRLEVRLRTRLQTNDFEADDVAVSAEYNLFPNVSVRAGGFMRSLHDPVTDENSTDLGVRIGTPLKFKLSGRAALVGGPQLSWGDQTIAEGLTGLQFNLVSAVALTIDTGLRWIDAADSEIDVPVSVGATISVTRAFDLVLQYQLKDVADHGEINDFDDRWLVAFFSFRA